MEFPTDLAVLVPGMGTTVAVNVWSRVVVSPWSTVVVDALWLLVVLVTEMLDDVTGTGTIVSLMCVTTEVFRNVATEVLMTVAREVLLMIEFSAASVLTTVRVVLLAVYPSDSVVAIPVVLTKVAVVRTVVDPVIVVVASETVVSLYW